MKIRELYEQVNSGHIISDIDLQREIIYDAEKQSLVIDSIVNDIPLPAFYFWKNNDGILEVLDGKQRIEAIKNFYQNNIQYKGKLYMQTDYTLQQKIDDTEIKDIICIGTEKLKREIFRRINTLGVPLSEYEVLNGLFNGEYLRGLSIYCEQDKKAKRILGKSARGAAKLTLLRLLGNIRNFSKRDEIYKYVNAHQNDSFQQDQRDLKRFVDFVAEIFDSYGGQLPIYFNLSVKYIKDVTIWKQHKKEINERIGRYLKSDDAKLTNKAKEIEDIINAIVKDISVDPKRLFSRDDKLEFAKHLVSHDRKYQCASCNKYFFLDELTMDHIDPWSKGGRTELSNAQLLCRSCNSKKGNK
ncbi:MAG: HNH endonuclease [Oscillospiraceae bacterium]|jgi:hypothetical protein|nr:HNH endonuclease [Oscillospiraceae bacterium]